VPNVLFVKALRIWLYRELLIARVAPVGSPRRNPYRAMHGTATGLRAPTHEEVGVNPDRQVSAPPFWAAAAAPPAGIVRLECDIKGTLHMLHEHTACITKRTPIGNRRKLSIERIRRHVVALLTTEI
jgi:hypothetical protein